jgi:hypothetical protein
MLVIGILYVGSGLVMTLLGRQAWKKRKARRLAKKAASSTPDDAEK